MPIYCVDLIGVRQIAGAVLAAVALSACAPGRPAPAAVGGVPSLPEAIRVRHQGRIERVAIDTYAAAVALTEIAPGALPAAVADALYESQIIVARTYAASRRGRHGAEGFDLCDATHCQRYEPRRLDTARWVRTAKAAAARTAGQVLVHQGRLIEAVFHADCGGHTADARDVWGAARAYLPAQRDRIRDPHRSWTSALDRERLAGALAADRRTRVDGPLREITIVRRDASGRAARIRIRGRGAVELDGDVFRAVVSSSLGIQALPSTRFTLRGTRDGWEATGTGFGHGVGLCQTGALARARAGTGSAGILGFYYPGAIIRRAGGG